MGKRFLPLIVILVIAGIGVFVGKQWKTTETEDIDGNLAVSSSTEGEETAGDVYSSLSKGEDARPVAPTETEFSVVELIVPAPSRHEDVIPIGSEVKVVSTNLVRQSIDRQAVPEVLRATLVSAILEPDPRLQRVKLRVSNDQVGAVPDGVTKGAFSLVAVRQQAASGEAVADGESQASESGSETLEDDVADDAADEGAVDELGEVSGPYMDTLDPISREKARFILKDGEWVLHKKVKIAE